MRNQYAFATAVLIAATTQTIALAQQRTPTYENYSSVKVSDPYGLKTGPNSAFSTTYGAGTVFSRPSRNGQSTMIGSSSVQTESATAGSFSVQPRTQTPAMTSTVPTISSPAFSITSSFSRSMASPALSPTSVTLNGLPTPDLTQGLPSPMEQGAIKLEGRHQRRGGILEHNLSNPLQGL